jgi:Kef-type K+ transport system membrane component KefB
MFLGGLEIDMDKLIYSFPKNKFNYHIFKKNPLVLAIFCFIITIALSYAGAKVLSLIVEIKNPWYFALMMGTTSVGIILPVLKNNGETAGYFGQLLIISAAIADIFFVSSCLHSRHIL